jgi:hypothetical protein
MFYKISALGMSEILRRSEKPSVQEARRHLMNIKKSDFEFRLQSCHDRVAWYQELDAAAVVIEEFGPDDMFTESYLLQHCGDELREIYAEMERLCDAVHTAFRRSARTGNVIFADHVGFPRYDSRGEWLSSETRGLISDARQARERLEYALADAATRSEIAHRNMEKSRELWAKQYQEA